MEKDKRPRGDVREGATAGVAGMKAEYYSTREYHLHGLQVLGWELTVCNALSVEGSPCRKLLKREGSYGELLYAFLNRFVPMKSLHRVIEIGGGYGYLMRDFLALQPGLDAVMLDLAPALLKRQRGMLAGLGVQFVQSDFLDIDPSFLRGFDLAVLNENLGDFPMVLNIGTEVFEAREKASGPVERSLAFYDRYRLPLPAHNPFHCNLGAMEAVEKLCTAGVPHIFLSEHSCEAVVPEAWKSFVDVRSQGTPERIRLRGHDEYTIAFTALQTIAQRLGYECVRGPLADFIEVAFTDRLRHILRSRVHVNEAHEAIRQFVEDLFKYEYLLLNRRV
jgi:hypothetical protein